MPEQMETNAGTKTARTILALLFLTLAIYFYWVCFINASIAPDEESFRQISLSIKSRLLQTGFLGIFSVTPELGYGSVYWLLSTLSITSDFRTSRIVNFVSILGIASVFLCAKPFASKRANIFIFLLWLSFPMAWWPNKLNGPEVLSTLLGLAGLLLSSDFKDKITNAPSRGNKNLRFFCAFLLAALSAGFKLNNFAFVFGVAASFACVQKQPKSWISYAWLGIPFGLFISNPFILDAPSKVLLLIPDSVPPTNYLQHFYQILNGYYWEWDLVFSGGLMYLTMSIVVWICFIPLLRLTRQTFWQIAPFCCVTLINLLGCLLNERFLGWYLFPTIVCLPFIVTALIESSLEKSTRIWHYALFVIFLNGVLNSQMVFSQGRVLAKNLDYIYPQEPKATHESAVISTQLIQRANFKRPIEK